MKFDRCYKSHTSASAPCANAGTSCTHSADNGIIAVLDAILVASIIIYGLIVLQGLVVTEPREICIPQSFREL